MLKECAHLVMEMGPDGGIKIRKKYWRNLWMTHSLIKEPIILSNPTVGIEIAKQPLCY